MKYEAGVKQRLEEDVNNDKTIDRNKKSGKSALKVQIAQLEGVIVGAEEEVEKAQEAYEDSKFLTPFSLKAIDDAEYKLKSANKALKGHQDDLKSRNALMKELF
jgi:hypothetical protein